MGGFGKIGNPRAVFYFLYSTVIAYSVPEKFKYCPAWMYGRIHHDQHR